MDSFEITGGAGPHEAAAVMAAIVQSMQEQAAASSIGEVTARPSGWQRADDDPAVWRPTGHDRSGLEPRRGE